jgi:hypothetical protein
MSEDDSVKVSDKTFHEFVKSVAITKVKSNRRNREVEIVLSETHLSWKNSNKFQKFPLNSIDIDFRKGKRGIFFGSIPAVLTIIKPKRDGDPLKRFGERWNIMFDRKQNDELKEFIKLFELTKKRVIKSIKKKENEIYYEFVKSEAIEKERDKDYDGAIETWEKLGAYDEILRIRKVGARERESARDYDSAIKIWDELGEIEEAARVRKLKAEEGSVKVSQKVVHGDDITKTEIKDSVLNRSNVGADGDDKLTKIKELKELLDSGAIDKDDYEKMKREIIG